jgi:SCY1-like protein 2
MKGLVGVLDKFSEGLRTRKILSSLLEEMKDTHLLPYILPSVFSIANILSPSQFASMVLPSLKPLFVVKEPPQNMLTLLDNLVMLQNKTEKNTFRERGCSVVGVIDANWFSRGDASRV